MIPKFKAAVQPDGTVELLLYGEIADTVTVSMMEAYGVADGLISATSVKKALDAAGNYSQIRVRINSPGGDAFEGIAIHSLLRAQNKPIEVCVDGIAASSASIVAMAGDVRTMGSGAMLMIHNAWCRAVGDATEMRTTADMLEKVSGSIAQVYVDRTGKSAEDIKQLMDAETWLSASDCLLNGFATQLAEKDDGEAIAMARNFKSLKLLKNVPVSLRESNVPVEAPPASTPEQESNISLYQARLTMLSIRSKSVPAQSV